MVSFNLLSFKMDEPSVDKNKIYYLVLTNVLVFAFEIINTDIQY